MTASTLDARCPRDPDQLAESPCVRCGTFTCQACAVSQEGQCFCPDCAQRNARKGGSWLSVSAGILSFLSLGCAPLGLVAILLAAIDLVSMASDEHRGREGLKLDLLAIGLSVVGLVLGVVLIMHLAETPLPAE